MVILAQDIKEVAGGHVDCERAVLKGSAQSRVQILEPVSCVASVLWSSGLCALVTILLDNDVTG